MVRLGFKYRDKRVMIALKQLFMGIMGSRYLAENVDRIAEKYHIDKNIFADATIELYEVMITEK